MIRVGIAVTGLVSSLGIVGIATSAPVPPMPPREGMIVLSYTQDGPPAETLHPSGQDVAKVASGAAKRMLTWPQAECPLLMPRLSADAKRLLAVRNGFSGETLSIWIFDVGSQVGPKEPVLSDLHNPSAVWSRDETKLFVSSTVPGKESDPYPKDGPYPRQCWTFDLKSRKRTMLDIPVGHEIVDLSPDGSTLLTVCHVRHDTENKMTSAAFLVPLDTLKPKQLAQSMRPMRYSPDGNRVLCSARNPKAVNPSRWEPAVCAIADGSLRFVPIGDHVTDFFQACWSPDGKRIAMVWQEETPPPKGVAADRKWRSHRVSICDSDGGRARIIVRAEPTRLISGVDWK
jgi:dipeptidyl aminopeptidase/acylaminoacyl peptidase